MKRHLHQFALVTAIAGMGMTLPPDAEADENLLGYVKGAETLPRGASEAYLWLTRRWDKGIGRYTAYDTELEYEYGVTSRFTAALALKGQAIDTSGLFIDAYLPGAEKYGLRPSGIEAKFRYNFLSPAKDDFGLSGQIDLSHAWLDPHSGRAKDTYSAGFTLLAQKYFLDDQLVMVGNAGFEGTYASRKPLDAATLAGADSALQALTGDPATRFEWPTNPEMELELTFGVGASYRFAPNWNIGAEVLYQTEFETGVGQERWSWQAGPSLHYGGRKWWATFTWLPQLRGGGERYLGQTDNLQLVEKTKQEVRLKIGYNF